jgi:hypothetical protein
MDRFFLSMEDVLPLALIDSNIIHALTAIILYNSLYGIIGVIVRMILAAKSSLTAPVFM